MIEETKNYVEANFPGAVVRYGDSVTGDTPVLTRVDGIISLRSMDSFGYRCAASGYGAPSGTSSTKAHSMNRRWYTDGTKEFANLLGVEAWTERGWTRVHTVIRHRTHKRIFEVLRFCAFRHKSLRR